jgi:hypothetical protein
MSACLADAPIVRGNRYNLDAPAARVNSVSLKADYRMVSRDSAQRRSLLAKSRFNDLASEWRRETSSMSSLNEMFDHPSYRAIIALGPDAVPHILTALKESSDFWFYALSEITGDDPVQEDDLGDIDLMTGAWLKWGKANGY